MQATRVLEDPFYYLNNFYTVLAWTGERYGDLLNDTEKAFLQSFPLLPKASQALLVRMVMRKGTLFRGSKLSYQEIGCPHQAALPLINLGWVSSQPLLSLEQLFTLLKKAELAQVFPEHLSRSSLRKAEQLEALKADFSHPQLLTQWCSTLDDCIYEIAVTDLCDRLRLIFFGNLHQDWSEFVLSDLGIFRYEKVAFSDSSRGFRIQRDIDDYMMLHDCRERFRERAELDDILSALPRSPLDNEWLEARRSKLIYEVAYCCEQQGNFSAALELYQSCRHPGARVRVIRVLEKTEQYDAAFTLASQAEQLPESDSEAQSLMRILPRLRRKLGLSKLPKCVDRIVNRIDLKLRRLEACHPVELCVQDHLSEPEAPVFYVENILINALLGLLCWEAIFVPLPGAFFHPFHRAPADIHMPQFATRRAQQFNACLSQLESGIYKDTIRRNFQEKQGIQAPFIAWGAITAEVLELALLCIPAKHLRVWFERILQNVKMNRTGFPDLIQFWPNEQRYRMIEVKGPGDRLQDNQIRWLDYCIAHEMPVCVCYVQWKESDVCNTASL
jgi:tetratricopeptide (TPR) repeat protein